MDYMHIQTVRDYLEAISVLRRSATDDNYSDQVKSLAEFASRTIFRTQNRIQITGKGHKEYRLNFDALVNPPAGLSASLIPVILVEPGDYDLGDKISISKANHLDDRVAA